MSGREPAYIRDFKAATKRDLTREDLEAAEKELYGESDRTAVIVLVSLLETAFSSFIRKLLRSNLSSDDKRLIFDFNGPLGTFSSQISIAYAFGLIGDITRHDLEIIRIIRNAAAHSPQSFSFEMPELVSLCSKLKIPDAGGIWVSTSYMEKVLGTEKVREGTKFDDNSAKTRFHVSVNTTYVRMMKPDETQRVAFVIPFRLP